MHGEKTFELTYTGNWTNETVRYTRVSVDRGFTIQVKEENRAGEWERNNFTLSFWLIRYLKLNSGALDWATFYCIQQYSLEKAMSKSWYSTLFFYDIFLNTVPEQPINVWSTWKESGYEVRLSPSLSISFPAIPFVGLLVKFPTWDDSSSTLGNSFLTLGDSSRS